jgi:hypothetical protein
MRGGDPVTFERINNLTLPPPNSSPLPYSSTFAASFSTAFSSDGMKFAVASQAGVLAVWDVRSSKPMKVFQTDKWRSVLGDGSYLSDDPTEWTRPEPGGPDRAPPFSIRNVKFGGGGASGKEVMTFTEVRIVPSGFGLMTLTLLVFLSMYSTPHSCMSWMQERLKRNKF